MHPRRRQRAREFLRGIKVTQKPASAQSDGPAAPPKPTPAVADAPNALLGPKPAAPADAAQAARTEPAAAAGTGAQPQVRKTPSWPRSWANFTPL
jgi:hypothetical protein